MGWFLKNTIDWKASDEKIKKAFLELTGEIPDLSNKKMFHTDEPYLHDAMYPNCNCMPDFISEYDSLLADEDEYKRIHKEVRTTKVTKGLF